VDVPQNAVYDYEVYSSTGGSNIASNVFFALINTCLSADTTNSIYGMPYAFTHKVVLSSDDPNFNTDDYMSDDGYNQWDDGDYVYIGFPWGSAALSQSVQTGYPFTYYDGWICDLIAYALIYDMTVNDAMDHASYVRFQMYFGQTDLFNDFTAYWLYYNGSEWIPMSGGTGSHLAVYGNGNIHLS
jgi:hypothetical protein